MDFWISDWISGFHSGFLDFWISQWISGFHSGFLDFWISQWISGFQFGFLPTVYEISFVTDPSHERFLLGTGRMPHPVGGAMGVTLSHFREN